MRARNRLGAGILRRRSATMTAAFVGGRIVLLPTRWRPGRGFPVIRRWVIATRVRVAVGSFSTAIGPAVRVLRLARALLRLLPEQDSLQPGQADAGLKQGALNPDQGPKQRDKLLLLSRIQ